jgi:tyrosine-protein kinase Etk/Wzc
MELDTNSRQVGIVAMEESFPEDRPETPNPIDQADLSHILLQLAYRKGLIAGVTSIAGIAGVALCFVLPVQYTATTKVMPPQQTQSTASMVMNQLTSSGAGSLAAMAGSGLGLKSPNDIYIGLLNSRPVADAIVHKFDLAKEYRAANKTDAIKKLAANTSVSTEKSGFIAISVTDRDRQRAAAMANAYTDELRAVTKTLAVGEASERRLFYEEQLTHSKETLVAAALAFQKVQQQKGLVQLDAQAKAMIEGLATLRSQVAAKQVEVQALRSYSTEHNPSVQLAENELFALRAEEVRMEQRNQAPGIAGLGFENVASAGQEYLRTEHELQYQQGLYDMLMRQYDAARLDESKEAAVIQNVEAAIPPDERSSPHRTSIVLTFIILGFLSACSYVYVCEFARAHPDVLRSLAELKCALLSR